MVFNQAKSVDVLPEIMMDSNYTIEVVDEIKLLGIFIRNNLELYSNTKKNQQMFCQYGVIEKPEEIWS